MNELGLHVGLTLNHCSIHCRDKYDKGAKYVRLIPNDSRGNYQIWNDYNFKLD